MSFLGIEGSSYTPRNELESLQRRLQQSVLAVWTAIGFLQRFKQVIAVDELDRSKGEQVVRIV